MLLLSPIFSFVWGVPIYVVKFLGVIRK